MFNTIIHRNNIQDNIKWVSARLCVSCLMHLFRLNISLNHDTGCSQAVIRFVQYLFWKNVKLQLVLIRNN